MSVAKDGWVGVLTFGAAMLGALSGSPVGNRIAKNFKKPELGIGGPTAKESQKLWSKINNSTRPNLGKFGNSIRNQLDSSFEKDLFENYWLGNGDMELTDQQFQNITKAIGNISKATHTNVVIDNVAYSKSTVSFYHLSEYDYAFGTATLYSDSSGKIVGLSDYYNFDAKPWISGGRSIINELVTRSVSTFSSSNSKPFNICYGVGCK